MAGDEYEIEIFPRTIFNNAAEMVPVTVQLLKPVDEMKLELVEIRGNRVILEWTQVADVTGARPLDQASFQIDAPHGFFNFASIPVSDWLTNEHLKTHLSRKVFN